MIPEHDDVDEDGQRVDQREDRDLAQGVEGGVGEGVADPGEGVERAMGGGFGRRVVGGGGGFGRRVDVDRHGGFDGGLHQVVGGEDLPFQGGGLGGGVGRGVEGL